MTLPIAFWPHNHLWLHIALWISWIVPASAASSLGSERKSLAGAVVRSREYVIRRSPHQIEEFSGDVRYHQGDRDFSADWAQFDHLDKIWRARGDVWAGVRLKGGEVLEARGHKAQYHMPSQKGFLVGISQESPVRFSYSAPRATSQTGSARQARDEGTARRLEFNGHARGASLEGSVHIRGLDGESWCDKATYAHDDRTLVLTGGRPVLVRTEARWTAALQAESVVASRGQGVVAADGNVHGWFQFNAPDTPTAGMRDSESQSPPLPPAGHPRDGRRH